MTFVESTKTTAQANHRKPLPIQVSFVDPEKESIQRRDFNLCEHEERTKFAKLILWTTHNQITATVQPV